eukprot:6204307-Pleurochrysis_carterae.AAC.3
MRDACTSRPTQVHAHAFARAQDSPSRQQCVCLTTASAVRSAWTPKRAKGQLCKAGESEWRNCEGEADCKRKGWRKRGQVCRPAACASCCALAQTLRRKCLRERAQERAQCIHARTQARVRPKAHLSAEHGLDRDELAWLPAEHGAHLLRGRRRVGASVQIVALEPAAKHAAYKRGPSCNQPQARHHRQEQSRKQRLRGTGSREARAFKPKVREE